MTDRLTYANEGRLLFAEVAVASVLIAVFGFIYVNGAFFSSLSGLWVDFSINHTAAHALRHGANPYGEQALFERAEAIGVRTDLIFRSLFTSYIQPPTSALSILPISLLGWPNAARAYLLLNNVFLIASIGLAVSLVRPSIPWLWVGVAGVVIMALFNQTYMSFVLGQVDATIALLLVIGLWGFKERRHAVTGSAIAIGAAIKLLPALLLLYFLWRKEYRTVAWGLGVGTAIFIVSWPIAGIDTYRHYFTETIPSLTKGSTFYSNISLVAAITRPYIDGPIGMLDPLLSLEEIPYVAAARILSMLATLLILGALAAVLGTRVGLQPRQRDDESELPVAEYFLVVAVALIVSSVTWDFYVVWLLPFFVLAAVAPDRVLHRDRRVHLPLLAVLGIAFIGLNYPADYVLIDLFDPNSIFYQPYWVPGVWLEERMNFYENHLSWVPVIRLVSLTLVTLTLAAVVLIRRLEAAENLPRVPEQPLAANAATE